MDQLFELFFSPQTILICLGIYVITFVVRRVVETTWPKVKVNRYWREIFVPIGPIVNGAVLGYCMKAFTWPEMVGTSVGGRILFGSVCGLFSAFLYNRIRAWLKTKGEKTTGAPGLPDSGSLPPPVLDSLPPLAEEESIDIKLEDGK